MWLLTTVRTKQNSLRPQKLALLAMAQGRGLDVGQAFRRDKQLQQYVLNDVTPTGRVLGNGSYGSVEEVDHL